MKLHIISILLIITTASCSKTISIDKIYRGINNNHKVISEELILNIDKSYNYNCTTLDLGQYASGIEYIGEYKIRKGHILFSLDTIKSYNIKVCQPKDKNPFFNHKTSVADSDQKAKFKLGEYRLKADYVIDKNYEVIKDDKRDAFRNGL